MEEFSWIVNARGKIGIREVKGKLHSELILKMWRAIKRGGIKDDETPWCAAFVGSCLEEVGLISSRFESAKSYLTWGIACNICYGCVVVIKRTGGSGYHVGFVVGRDNSGRIHVLSGNQNDAVNVMAFDPARIEACRWPQPVFNPKSKLPVLSITESSSSEA